MKHFYAETTINAPAETVWALLTDAGAYTSWNSTVNKIEGKIAPGEKIKVHAKVNPDRAFPVKVSEFEAPRRMVWSGGMPLGLFKGERVFKLDPVDGGVKFSMDEKFTGPLAGLIGKSIPDLQPSFDEFAANLKAKAEA